ncbi:MAG: hypothetical protein ACRD0K_03635 [Egibacteraceae bacterium]
MSIIRERFRLALIVTLLAAMMMVGFAPAAHALTITKIGLPGASGGIVINPGICIGMSPGCANNGTANASGGNGQSVTIP